jgi:hypothetical protein
MSDKEYQRHASSNEEINLYTIIKIFGRLADRFILFAGNVITLINRNFKLIAAISIIGGLAGVAYTYIARPVYGSHAIVSSKVLPNEYCESLISELHYLTKEENYAALQTNLNITHDQAVNIVDISYLNFNIAKEDTIGGEPFGVQVRVYDNKVLDTLERAIMNYLENNPYALKRKNAKDKILKDFAEKMHGEINDLDSLKKRVNKGLMSPQFDKDGKIIGVTYLNPIDTYKEVMDMYEQKLDLIEQITLLSNFELIQGFTHRSKPVYPRKLRDPIVAALISFLIALWVARRKEKQSIKNAISNQQVLEAIGKN